MNLKIVFFFFFDNLFVWLGIELAVRAHLSTEGIDICSGIGRVCAFLIAPFRSLGGWCLGEFGSDLRTVFGCSIWMIYRFSIVDRTRVDLIRTVWFLVEMGFSFRL